jgi:small-conductance mechanosensitive channel
MNKSSLFKRIFIQASQLPVFYLLIGVGLLAAAIFNPVPFIAAEWLVIASKVGATLIVIAVATFFYKAIVLISLYYEQLLNDQHAIASLVLSSIRKGLRIIYLLIVLHIILAFAAPTDFYIVLVNKIIQTLIIGFVGWVVIQFFYTAEAIIYQRMLIQTDKEYRLAKALYTKMHVIRNVMTVLIIIVTTAAILMTFDNVRNIGISLLASAGFLTAIIGLAAQKALASLVSGIQIALSQPIKIGDTVVFENQTGSVEEITLTYVTLKLSDKRRLILPISFFIEKPFFNWSHEGDHMISSVCIYIDFLMPIEPLRTALNKILSNSTYWDKKISKLEVTDVTDRAVQICIQLSASNVDNVNNLRSEVREKMLNFVREHYPEYFPKMRFQA